MVIEEDKEIRSEQQMTKKIAYDVGQKIGGSRKDLAALRKEFQQNPTLDGLKEIEEQSASVAAELLTKSQLLSEFSLEDEKQKSVEPAVARIKQLIIQRIEKIPGEDSPQARKQFFQAIREYQRLMKRVKTMDDLLSTIKVISERLYLEELSYDSIERRIMRCANKLDNLKGKQRNQWLYRLREYKTQLGMKKEAEETPLRVLGDKFCSFFSNQKSCKTTINNTLQKVSCWDDLLQQKKKGKTTTRKPVWERDFPERLDRKGGRFASIERPEDLINVFNFRGVEFGNYVDDQKGKEHLQRSSEAMMDLADVLGVDDKVISLFGRLGIGYGARGRGKALGHYEPVAKVINLTKERGVMGIFAHEFAHALDHYLYDLSHYFERGRPGHVSTFESIGNGLNESFRSAIKDLMETMTEGSSVDYFENSNKDGDRWSLPNRMKTLYELKNGDLYSIMEVTKEDLEEQLENKLKLSSLYGGVSETEQEKLDKKFKRDLKKKAQAFAWYHEKQTGERVEKIPYPVNRSSFLQNAIQLDRGKIGKYWSSPEELFARSFEAWTEYTLKERNRKNDYLVTGTTNPIAFPVGEERDRIFKCMSRLMNRITEDILSH